MSGVTLYAQEKLVWSREGGESYFARKLGGRGYGSLLRERNVPATSEERPGGRAVVLAMGRSSPDHTMNTITRLEKLCACVFLVAK
jgi:hypothetical protein